MNADAAHGQPITPAEATAAVFVVIPAFNEASCIEQVVQAVRAAGPLDVVVVDDGSTDGTGDLARRFTGHVLRHLINRGQGAALQTGIEFALLAGARIIVTFDADGQHCAEDVSALVAPIEAGTCDIVLGSRFLGRAVGLPGGRRLLLRFGVWFTRLVSGAKLTDVHNGLRAFSRRAAERIRIRLDGMAHASELVDQIVRSGLAYQEVPVTVRYTPYSKSKGQSSRGAFRVALHYLLGRMIR